MSNLYGTSGNDTLYGGAANDAFTLYEGVDYVYTGGGSDDVNADSGVKYIDFQGGGGTFRVNDGQDATLNITGVGASANVSVYAPSAITGPHNITFGAGSDAMHIAGGGGVFNLGAGDNNFNTGGGGAVTITAAGGNDTVYFYNTQNQEPVEPWNVNVGDGDNAVSTAYGPSTVISGAGADNISTKDGSDSISSGAGNDYITTGEGNDTVYSGAGNDVIHLYNGDALVVDGSGDTELYFLSGAVTARLGDGVHVIGTEGKDSAVKTTIDLSTGANSTTSIYINNSDGPNHITLGNGSDPVYVGAGGGVFNLGGGSNDFSAGGGGDVKVTAGSGDDLIRFHNGIGANSYQKWTVDAGAGANTVSTADGDAWVKTGSGVDNIATSYGNDTILSGAGDDFIKSGGGDDTINSGAGNDTVLVGSGHDTVQTGSGDSTIITDIGYSDIRIGGGNQLVANRDGDGSAGPIDYSLKLSAVANSSVRIYEPYAVGSFDISTGNGNDYFHAPGTNGTTGNFWFGAGDDSFSMGGGGSAVVKMGDGDDQVSYYNTLGLTNTWAWSVNGGAGNDIINLRDGAGSDSITGGPGSDTIIGGLGVDTIGGAQEDDAVYMNDGVTGDYYLMMQDSVGVSNNDTVWMDVGDKVHIASTLGAITHTAAADGSVVLHFANAANHSLTLEGIYTFSDVIFA